jgi:hypothetical protein
MAGVIMPNGYIAITGAGAADFSPLQSVPVGKAESCCIMACLGPGSTVDAFCTVAIADPSASPPGANCIFYEPVRYRQPGGSPVLVQDFIVTAGQHLYVTNHSAGTINFILFNRWQFDA